MSVAPASTLRLQASVLVVDDLTDASFVAPSARLAELFEPGDLLVVNDAATIPASLRAVTAGGVSLELRLMAQSDDGVWTAGLLGPGDWRTRTEDRAAPPKVSPSDRLAIVPRSSRLVAIVEAVRPESPRLVELRLVVDGDEDEARLWPALYEVGVPIQYAHVPDPLALWDVQNVYAARPWAFEMPSAGRLLRGETLIRLARRGVDIARVTHAAGVSSIGDPVVDAMLPLPERYEVTEETWEAIAKARRRGGRVVAIGTSTTRALEGAVRTGKLRGTTALRLGPDHRRVVVDAVLSGIHDLGTSHFDLLRAFARDATLERMLAEASQHGLLGHELGDACLVWGRKAASDAPKKNRENRTASR